MSDLRDAQKKQYISKVPHYNSIFNYFENEALTPYLQMLVEESSLPLQAIESDFAVDSSGFSTCRFVQWVNAKYTTPQLMTKREWVKVHLMCGVKTNIVTAVEIADRYAADTPHFKQLVDTTAQNFVMQSNVESTFHMIKAKFRDSLRSKTKPHKLTKLSARFSVITFAVSSSQCSSWTSNREFWATETVQNS